MSIESRSRQYGKVFDHWQIKEFLGSGSGGKTAVFRLQRSDSSWGACALKIVNLIEERGNVEELSDFRRREYEAARAECSRSAEQEVRLMDELRGNTNIVDYLDHTFVDWSDESGFGRDLLIRMELLEDLRSDLKNGRMFSQEEVLKIGRDICAALMLCHKKNILHRDVKPENIFRNKDGNYKLGDFGVSRVLDACPGAVASTGIGTYEYWPAEQMTGRYDKRVDLYSLGLVLYELSNGNRLPFAASTYATGKEVSLRLSGSALPTPSEAGPILAKVILKATAFKPEDRYQSAEEFQEALNWVGRMNKDIAALEFLEQDIPSVRTIPARPSDVPKTTFETQPAQDRKSSFETQPARAGKHANGTYLKKQNRRNNKRVLVFLAALLLCAGVGIFAGQKVWTLVINSSPQAIFEALGIHWDSAEQAEQIEKTRLSSDYAAAESLAQSGKTAEAAMAFYALGEKERSFELWEKVTAGNSVSAGSQHTVCLKTNGTVAAVGDNAYGQCNVDDWADIVSVSAGWNHTVALKFDANVVAVGSSYYDNRCYVDAWTDIVAVSAGSSHTVGLKADGTVVAVGSNSSGQCKVGDWTDIVSVSAGSKCTVGLKSDGTVVAVGSNDSNKILVEEWADIVAISTEQNHTVGLKSDGTVIATGSNAYHECEVDDWTDIVSISVGAYHTVGLKSDGTVVATGQNGCGQCDVDSWTDIVAIATGLYTTVGLKSDGTLITVGDNYKNQLNVQDWTDIMLPSSDL